LPCRGFAGFVFAGGFVLSWAVLGQCHLIKAFPQVNGPSGDTRAQCHQLSVYQVRVLAGDCQGGVPDQRESRGMRATEYKTQRRVLIITSPRCAP
jgi:hypothetical protein